MEILTEKSETDKNVKPRGLSAFGKTLLAVTGGIGIGITVICASFVSPALRKHCLPYVPATSTQVANVLSLLKRNASGKLLDIGSGDGRIVIAAATKYGIESHGVELNPWLVLYSKIDALRQRVSGQTKFFKQDLWKFNLSPYDYIVIFGVDKMMNDFESKLIQEAHDGSQIIACRFPLPNLNPEKIIGSGVDTVWLYHMKRK